MTERGDPENVEVEMLEDGPLLGDEDIQKQEFQQRSPPKRRRSTEWLIWGVLIICFLVALLDNIRLRRRQSCTSAFGTDLTIAKDVSELIQYRFTGGIQVDHEGKLYRDVNPLEPQYAGEPVPEIDKAWDDLLSAVDLRFDVDDLHGAERASVPTGDGKGVLISLDVYHSLHCVNLVRKAIDFRYYHPTGQVPYFYRSHVDHCVDYLRQAIQCQSDLSPLTYARTPTNHTVPVFGTPHTCRNFSKVHEWAMQRRNQEEAV